MPPVRPLRCCPGTGLELRFLLGLLAGAGSASAPDECGDHGWWPGGSARCPGRGRRPGLFCGEERPGAGRVRGNHTHVISQAGALFDMEDTRWDQALKVTGEGEGLVGHQTPQPKPGTSTISN